MRTDHWDEFYKSEMEKRNKDDYLYGFGAVTSGSSGFAATVPLTLDELRERVMKLNMPVIVGTMPHATIVVYSRSWYPYLFEDMEKTGE